MRVKILKSNFAALAGRPVDKNIRWNSILNAELLYFKSQSKTVKRGVGTEREVLSVKSISSGR
jgi:hypothetical protein